MPFGAAELVRARIEHDAWIFLPDGRSVFMEFQNRPKTIGEIKDFLLDRFRKQFPGDNLNIWSACSCKSHWVSLDDDWVVSPGDSFSGMSLPAALGTMTGLIPELQAPDVMIRMQPAPVRAKPLGAHRPAEPSDPPPWAKKPKKMPRQPPKECPGPPPARILQKYQTEQQQKPRTTSTMLFPKGPRPAPKRFADDDSQQGAVGDYKDDEKKVATTKGVVKKEQDTPNQSLTQTQATSHTRGPRTPSSQTKTYGPTPTQKDANVETPTIKEVPPKLEVKQEPETPTEASNVQETTEAPVKIAEPEDEFSVETPVPRTYHITGRQVLLVFPSGKTEVGKGSGIYSLRSYVDRFLPRFPLGQHVLYLNGQVVENYDMLNLVPPKDDEETTKMAILKIRERGLPGGASDLEIKACLTNVLEGKGLVGLALTAKVQETVQKLGRAELLHWSMSPTWALFKQVAGNRVTFFNKPRRDVDPLEERDPWALALKEKDKSSSSGSHPKDHNPAQVCLIADVWSNEDGSVPQILDRPQNGSTGIVLVTPQQFTSDWLDTALPLSADELLLIVWPPVQPPPPGVAHEPVTFPARLLTTSSTITLLHGQAYQFGAKAVTLRKDANPTDFPTRSSVSLLFEAYQDELSATLWDELQNNPMGTIKKRMEQITPILGNWGTRFWNQKGKPVGPHDAYKLSTNLLVDEDKLDILLQKSGDPYWLSPRLDQPAFARFRPIWIGGNLEQVRIAHAKLAGACGLIRTKKGYGVRVHADRYDESRKQLLPHEPSAPHLGRDQELWHYKISPTPVGSTAQDILLFIGKCIPNTKGTVKRQLGPRAWLISFVSKIDTEYVQSQEGFVVLQPWSVGKRHDPMRGAIAVGNPRILKEAVAQAYVHAPSRGQTPSCPLAPPARTAQGPIQEMLEAKIKASEDRMRALIDDQKALSESRHADVRSRLDQHQACQEARSAKLEEALNQHRTETQQAVHELKQTTQGSHAHLEKSMAEQFSAMLSELSKLTRGDSKRSPAPSPEGNPTKQQKSG